MLNKAPTSQLKKAYLVKAILLNYLIRFTSYEKKRLKRLASLPLMKP